MRSHLRRAGLVLAAMAAALSAAAPAGASGPPVIPQASRARPVDCQAQPDDSACAPLASGVIDRRTVYKAKGVSTMTKGAIALDQKVRAELKRLDQASAKAAAPALPPLAFGVAGLDTGSQVISPGHRSLVVRIVGGSAPFKVELLTPAGMVVSSGVGGVDEVVLAVANIPPGAYAITAIDARLDAVTASVKVAVRQPPPQQADFKDVLNPEVRAAEVAIALAKAEPHLWAFEAEQRLNAAPHWGLNRVPVYQLIERYAAQ